MAILAPKSFAHAASYLTGWVNVIAWQSSCIGETFINAKLIQELASLNYAGYSPKEWHAVLIFYAVIAAAVVITTVGGRIFPKFEALTLILHVTGFFAILITLVYLGPKNDTDFVFKNFQNGGGFSSDVQAWFVGSVTVMFTFIGEREPVDMKEKE